MVQNKHAEIHLNFNLHILVVGFRGNGGDRFECLARAVGLTTGINGQH